MLLSGNWIMLVSHVLGLYTNDNGRLAPLTCHEYSTVMSVKHIKIAQQ